MSDGIGNSMPLWEQRQLKNQEYDAWMFEQSRQVVGIPAQELFELMFMGKPTEDSQSKTLCCPKCKSTSLSSEWGDDDHGHCGNVYTCDKCGNMFDDHDLEA